MPPNSLARRNAPLQIEYISLDRLKPMPDAPRAHPKSQIASLVKSIAAFGFNVPVLVDSADRIVAGQARVTAATKLGLAEAPAIRIDHLNETQIKAFMVADNRLAELGKWDDRKLGSILMELSQVEIDFDLEATGFALAEIELRIAGLDDEDDEGEKHDALSGPPVVMAGELWQLGEHRLICGSALEDQTWQTLMGEDRAALVVTDPPFNVPINGHVSGLGRHQHREFVMAAGEMTPVEFTKFLTSAMRQAHTWSTPGSVHYWAMDWRHVLEIGLAGQAVYQTFLNICVWSKNQPGMGSFYRSQHEFFFVYAKGGARPRNNVQLGKYGRSRSNIWSYPGAASLARTSEEGNPLAMHPTVKPLALISDAFLDASVRGDVVVDPFAGSGTTLIAAEKLGRKARVIELDPLYCDTIIRRWSRWTGDDAIRIADGQSFKALSEERGQS